jgi:hypothetical protein
VYHILAIIKIKLICIYHVIYSVTQQPASKWGDLGSLVNLGSLSKDVSLAKQAQQAAAPSNYTPSSFAGLDGFGKSQSMVRILSRSNFMIILFQRLI